MNRKKFLLLFVLALLIAAFLSPFASSFPDGLEKVAAEQNFLFKAQSFFSGLLPDYLFPGINHPALTTAMAGICGVLTTFGLIFFISRLILFPKKAAPLSIK